ncbi:MAG: biotin--[acetyl-CoA-carboxylase] ligase [Alphaproteobacteria bacterium]
MISKLPAGWTEHRFDSLGSTMDAARDMAESGGGDRILVRADTQSGGRGRYGRPWMSEAGNLYLTVILRENRPLSDCAQLSFAASLALADAIPLDTVRLKWPNDVLIRGCKTAGILLEAGGEAARPWILIGIGVNVAHHPVDTPYAATSLAAEGLASDLDALCRDIALGIDHWRGIWHKQGAAALHRAWLDRAKGVGEPIRVRLRERQLDGVFEALDGDGRLIVRTDDGKRHAIAAGDVFFD